MAKTKTNLLDASTAITILNELGKLSQAIEETRKKIIMSLPAKYGSDLWWERSDEEAIRQIKAGKGITIKNKEELQKFLGL